MNQKPQLETVGLRGSYMRVVRMASWRQDGMHITWHRGSGWGEEVS
jgi:hypothetical protein